MKNEKLYREAIRIAVDDEIRFLCALKANESFKGNRVLKEKHHQLEVGPAASVACAQQELIAELFGVSEEKVHEDITNLIAGR
ncbi:hypothetical protein [Adlercreutzia sp.]|uniref:hypothetical protein n=1 Tax=Adlercreutzia sp. TaxID=1872387 RepID=UPI003AB29063